MNRVMKIALFSLFGATAAVLVAIRGAALPGVLASSCPAAFLTDLKSETKNSYSARSDLFLDSRLTEIVYPIPMHYENSLIEIISWHGLSTPRNYVYQIYQYGDNFTIVGYKYNKSSTKTIVIGTQVFNADLNECGYLISEHAVLNDYPATAGPGGL